MRHLNRRLIPLLVVVPLTGCDIAKDLPLTPEEMRQAASPFGMATRELVEDTGDGKVYRVMVESRRAASWVQAGTAMWEAERRVCPDGERYQYLTQEPAKGNSPEDVNREHPPGTLFTRTLRCAPKPPYEFEFESPVTVDEAYGRMVRRLLDAAPDTTGKHVVLPIAPSRDLPKYRAIENLYGTSLHLNLSRCPSGVKVSHPQIGMYPPDTVPPGPKHIVGYAGFVIECVDAAEAAAAAAPAPGA